jgi:hypothetical protein
MEKSGKKKLAVNNSAVWGLRHQGLKYLTAFYREQFFLYTSQDFISPLKINRNFNDILEGGPETYKKLGELAKNSGFSGMLQIKSQMQLTSPTLIVEKIRFGYLSRNG